MSTQATPTIIQGEILPYTRKPFLTRKIGNKLVAMFNMITRAKVVSPDNSISGQFKHGSFGSLTLELSSTGSGSGTTGAWHWAATKIYTKLATNAVNEIIWVQLTADEVVNGAIDATTGLLTYATPGMYIALQPVFPVSGSPNKYHLPLGTPPVPDDPTSALNYWWPLANGNCY